MSTRLDPRPRTTPPPGRTGAPRNLLDRHRGAQAGAVAAAVTLGVGEFVAGMSRSIPSPMVAVGDAVIDFSPGGVERTAIDLVGTADKPLLLVGVIAVWLGAGAVAGRLATRRPGSGLAPHRRASLPLRARSDSALAALIPVVLIAAATAAALRDQMASPAGVVFALLVAAAAGTGAWAALVRAGTVAPTPDTAGKRPRRTPAPSMAPPDPSRRRFLALAGGLAAVAATTAVTGRFVLGRMQAAAARAAVILPRPTKAAAAPAATVSAPIAGITPFVTPNADFYRIDTALVIPDIDPAGWSVKVGGMVRQPFSLSFDELLGLPLVEEYVTMACVSNEVGGDLIGNAKWLGYPLSAILERAGVEPGGDQIVGRSVDGFTAGFPTELAFDGRTALLAVGMNGEPLPLRHGFPARLVVAGLYGYVSSTKWLDSIEVVPAGFDGYWIPRGWSKDGPVKTQSRIDVVREAAGRPGTLVAAGVAWAVHRGVSRVELRLDGGEWTEARLADDFSRDTWRQWSAELTPPPGRHTLEVRATDGRGMPQVEERSEVYPDGATGLHTFRIEV